MSPEQIIGRMHEDDQAVEIVATEQMKATRKVLLEAFSHL